MQSDVFLLSRNMLIKASYYYYEKGYSQSTVADLLGISVSTVSRLLKKAREEKIVQFIISDTLTECIFLEEKLKKVLGLKDIVVAPITDAELLDPTQGIKAVALEGARYLQRFVNDGDVLGIAWGRTMYHLINRLNPCQKSGTSFVTLTGSLESVSYSLTSSSLVERIAMAFGGSAVSFNSNAFFPDEKSLTEAKRTADCQKVFEAINRTTISISGVGSLYPIFDSPLMKSSEFNDSDRREIIENKPYGDLMLRFFDSEGQLCDFELNSRTLAIDYDTYKSIPTKIIVANGAYKVDTIVALLKGKLVDVLIIDSYLAERLLSKYE